MLRHLPPWSTLAPASRLPLLHPSHQTATKASLTSPTPPFLLLTMLALRSSPCQPNGRVGELKHLLLLSIPALGFFPAILLLHAFDRLVSLARKPVYLFPAYFGELGRKPTSSSCSTEQQVIGRGVVSIRQSIRARGRWKASFSLSCS